jgi:hypothetical protein
MGGISEVYPGDIWHRLVGRTIPKKSTQEGRRVVKQILQALGIIGLLDLPTHDQNDRRPQGDLKRKSKDVW